MAVDAHTTQEFVSIPLKSGHIVMVLILGIKSNLGLTFQSP